MLITGKITDIVSNDVNGNSYTIVIEKTRKGKKIELAIIIWGFLTEKIRIGEIAIGKKYDVQVYFYSKRTLSQGKTYFNSYIVAETIREYKPNAQRFNWLANKDTGEIIMKQKGILPKE